MANWTADYVNDPDNDYEIVVEIRCDGEDVAWIIQGANELYLKWYAHNIDIVVPVDWMLDLLLKVKKSLKK